MKVLKNKGLMVLYGCSAMGVNLLNLMMGSYLCSALLVGGFGAEAIPYQTFEGKDLVVAAAWAVFVVIAKIIDGVIDIPMATLTDNLKSKWGRRRPTILIGLIVLIASFLLFALYTPQNGETWLNTVYYGIVLCVFYSSYTLTMVSYYATFTEIVDNEQDRNFISNVKSVCDIVYFIIGYVVVGFILKGLNIRMVSLIILPLVLLMLIPMFLIKEPSTLNTQRSAEKQVNIFKSLAYTFRNKDFICWMVVYFFLTFGVQLFLGGINEYFSYRNMSMMYVMAASFAPVPLTLILYNWIIKKRGFRFAIQYVLLIFAVAMLMLFGISYIKDDTTRTVLSVVGGLASSFAVGAIFSVAYSIPSQLAADDEQRTGISHSAMYFAVQGLFSGVASGLATGVVLTALKKADGAITYMTIISAIACVIAFTFTYILPQSIVKLGRVEKVPAVQPSEATSDADTAENLSEEGVLSVASADVQISEDENTTNNIQDYE